MEIIYLGRDDVIEDRPFTNIKNCAIDLQIMRFLCATACLLVMETDLLERSERPYLQYLPDEESWVQRLIVTRPNRLAAPEPITVVGFFGRRRPDADVALAQRLDKKLLPELSRFKELYAYLSLKLPTGNFANLVLFDSFDAKEKWGESNEHARAVSLLTPDYYSSVRLYNGELPQGLADINDLHLNTVKYLDYSEEPMWRAERNLELESVA